MQQCKNRGLQSGLSGIPNVILVGGVVWRPSAGEEGEDRGPGSEQCEAVDEDAAEHGDQVHRRDYETPYHSGQDVAPPVVARGEYYPPPHEVRGYERPEEDQGKVRRSEKQEERYPHYGDREHHAEYEDHEHRRHSEEQRPSGGLLSPPGRRQQRSGCEYREQHSAGSEHCGAEGPAHEIRYSEPVRIVIHVRPRVGKHSTRHGVFVAPELPAPKRGPAQHPSSVLDLEVSTTDLDVASHGSVDVYVSDPGLYPSADGAVHLDVTAPSLYVVPNLTTVYHGDVAHAGSNVPLDFPLDRDIANCSGDIGHDLSLLHDDVSPGLFL